MCSKKMENKIAKYTRSIIEAYALGEFDPGTVRAVKLWLGNDKNSSEKEGALTEYWNCLDNEETHRSYCALLEVRRSLKMSEFLAGSIHRNDPDANTVTKWYRDMSEPSLNPGAKYYGRQGGKLTHRPAAERVTLHDGLRSRRVIVWMAAAIIPVLILLGLLMGHNETTHLSATQKIVYTTGEYESKRFTMPDGTEVVLNENSRLEYLNDRETSLVGEAYFNVESDPSHPFIVDAGKAKIKVTGTEFNINAYRDSNHTNIDHYAGKVEVTIGGNSYMMSPGERIHYDHLANQVSRTTAEKSLKPEWMQDRLSMIDKTIPEILASLEWFYNVSIAIPENIDSKSLYVFELEGDEDINATLDMLRSVSGAFDYTIDGNTVIIKAIK